MKKLIPLLLSLLLLTACGAPEPADPVDVETPDDSSTTQVVNPWQDFASAEEMEAFLSFDFSVPDKVQDVGALTAYRAMENMAEVCYENGLTLRKAEGTGDISGDYNEYAETNTASTLDESGTVEMMGNDGLVYKAIWEMGGYAYSATYESGMEVHVMAQLVMQVQ